MYGIAQTIFKTLTALWAKDITPYSLYEVGQQTVVQVVS